MTKLSLPKDRIRILLLEGIHQNAVSAFAREGYTNVERVSGALSADVLLRRIEDVHVVGIRSRTHLTRDVLERAQKLFCVGCFCIGTDQVDLTEAEARGIPVFNAPYSNTRSVAELVIGELIMLMRRIPEKSNRAHQGIWSKSASGAYEIRGKTLGIVGYGHIGSQLSILGEAMGMQIRYYDIVDKLALGGARPCASLQELLGLSDVVSLHVPETPETRGMIGEQEIRAMRPGSYLVNASRGSVVDIPALAAALRDGHIEGAAVDVFPVEPKAAGQPLESPLQGLPNVILTPHIGGSTQEAQASIGEDVARKLARYSDTGSTTGSVNFVEVSLPVQEGVTRFLHIHRNVPGVLAAINRVFSLRGFNVAAQYLRTDPTMGYVVVDVEGAVDDSPEVRDELLRIEGSVRVRVLH